MWRLIFALALGCRAHVQLAAAPVNAPEAARIAAYERLEPVDLQPERGKHRSISDYHLDLADGTRVEEAEDLVPVVDPESATARAGEQHRHAAAHRRRNNVLGPVTLVALGALLALELAEIRDVDHLALAMVATGLVGAAAIVPQVIIGNRDDREALDSQLAAFKAYDTDVRHRLGLCVDGLRLISCDRMKPAWLGVVYKE